MWWQIILVSLARTHTTYFSELLHHTLEITHPCHCHTCWEEIMLFYFLGYDFLFKVERMKHLVNLTKCNIIL